jgi:hypothetical protein
METRTARIVKQLNVRQSYYKLSHPTLWTDREGGIHDTYHVIVSMSKYYLEKMVFPCTAEGNVVDYMDLVCKTWTLDEPYVHDVELLSVLGYELVI